MSSPRLSRIVRECPGSVCGMMAVVESALGAWGDDGNVEFLKFFLKITFVTIKRTNKSSEVKNDTSHTLT